MYWRGEVFLANLCIGGKGFSYLIYVLEGKVFPNLFMCGGMEGFSYLIYVLEGRVFPD